MPKREGLKDDVEYLEELITAYLKIHEVTRGHKVNGHFALACYLANQITKAGYTRPSADLSLDEDALISHVEKLLKTCTSLDYIPLERREHAEYLISRIVGHSIYEHFAAPRALSIEEIERILSRYIQWSAISDVHSINSKCVKEASQAIHQAMSGGAANPGEGDVCPKCYGVGIVPDFTRGHPCDCKHNSK